MKNHESPRSRARIAAVGLCAALGIGVLVFGGGFLINIKPRCSMVYIDTGLSLKHLVQIEKVISNSDSTSLQLSPAT